ncbi:MAG TPA: universal stress protein [Fulvivirga sp.]|nr:universal stress protein [Fulvivirga sp.]
MPIALASFGLLLFITFRPLFKHEKRAKRKTPHGQFTPLEFVKGSSYKKIAVAVDFSDIDSKAINSAVAQGGKQAEYLLIHVVESTGAWMMGREISDLESGLDRKNLQKYADQMKHEGYNTSIKLGYGLPKQNIPKIVDEFEADLLVMGAHGHMWFKDLLFGTTVDAVRHRLKVPIFIVRC